MGQREASYPDLAWSFWEKVKRKKKGLKISGEQVGQIQGEYWGMRDYGAGELGVLGNEAVLDSSLEYFAVWAQGMLASYRGARTLRVINFPWSQQSWIMHISYG